MIYKKYKFNKIFFKLAILIGIVSLFSCSSTKEIKKEIPHSTPVITIDTFEVINFKKNINSLECSGEIEFADTRQSMSGTFEMKILRQNKLSIDVFGPFGINVARIYASEDSVIVYNLWEGKYYQSKGNLDGFEFLAPFASKLFNILVAEPFYEKDSLLKVVPENDSLGFKFKFSDTNYYRFNYRRNFASITYLNYTFKKNVFEVYLKKFNTVNELFLPYNIDIYDQTNKNQLKIKIDEFKSINKVPYFDNEHKSKFKKVNSFQELF